MTREETAARQELATLAAQERGRALLQLALRGIQESGRGLTVGCWVRPGGGVAGCVFQHAYWQGVAEGAFAPTPAERPEIGELVPEDDVHLVFSAIRALDALGKRRFTQRHGLQRTLDEAAWRSSVEQLLVDALAASATRSDDQPALATA
jgi:hypothetical protein